MAAANKLEVTLSFKPVMDGLNRFTAGINQRLQQVQTFNQKIQNGEAAMRQMVGHVGALLGGAALVSYARDAREADKVQAQLIQTLRKTGQTGAADALNAQAAALQRVTEFSDEAVNTVQRLLISFGLTAAQAEGLTENVLDFAQATGQSAESAAMLIGRTLAGDSDELGRYQIKLDTTKGKVDALRDALGRYAGQARSAVPDAGARDVAARYADATESLGRAANTVAVPFLQALIPLLEKLATWATANATQISAFAGQLGDMAAVAAPAVLVIGGLSGASKALLAVVNPLRSAFMLFAGRSLVELSAQFTKVVPNVQGLWYVLRDGQGVLKGIGAATAVAGTAIAAFFAGWEIGRIVGEVEVAGSKLKNWVSGTLLQIVANLMSVWGGIKSFFSAVSSGLASFYLALELGARVALNPLSAKRAWADYRTQLKSLAAQATKDLAEIKAETERRVAEFSGMAVDVVDEGRPGSGGGAGAGAAAGAPGADANSQHFGDTDAKRKAEEELQAKRAAAELENLILAARLAGDAKLEQSLILQRDYQAAINDLGKEASGIVDRRQALELALEEKRAKLAADERSYTQAAAEIAQRKALIEANGLLTEQEKTRQLIPLTRELIALVEARRTAVTALMEKADGDTKNELQSKIDELNATIAQLRGENQGRETRPSLLDQSRSARNDLTDPAQHYQGVGDGIEGGINNTFAQIGTAGDAAAQTISGTLNSALSETGNLLYGLATGSVSFEQAWKGALLNVGQTFAKMATDMVAKLLWKHTVEAALIKLGVITHVGGEQAKTGATLMGGAKRLAMVAKEALADVYHGAVAAFKALAGIPYVGPLLAGAAMAAALAGGVALVGKIAGHEKGGVVRGGKQLTWINEKGEEGVLNAPATAMVGEPFINALNAGRFDIGTLPADIAAGITSPSVALAGVAVGGGGGGAGFDAAALVDALAKKISLKSIVVPDERAATRIARRSAAADDIVEIVRSRRSEIFRNGPR